MNDKLSLIETIAKQDKFSTFSRIMGSSGANAAFSAPGSFTVFAPTNDAFSKIPDEQMKEWVNETGQAKLKALLSYHILPSRVDATKLSGLKTAKSVSGQEMTFTDSNGIKVNGSSLQARNIEATNGLVHAIDTVLSLPVTKTAPPVAAAASSSVL